jgi:DNA-binding transcriptional LysR family regulator
VSLADLQGQALISMPPESGIRRLIDSAALSVGVRLHHAITLHQFGTLFDLVRAGLGLAIVPASVLPSRADRTLHVRKLAGAALTRRVGILTLGDRILSPAAASFRDIFRTHYSAAARERRRSRGR